MDKLSRDLSKAQNSFMRGIVDDILNKPSFMQTDELIKETVPAHRLRLPVPYFRWDSDTDELRIGMYQKTLLSWGKKTITRRAFIWEGKSGKALKHLALLPKGTADERKRNWKQSRGVSQAGE